METYKQNLHISDEAFESMRKDADRVLQRLIKSMIEKESFEGELTISIDVSLFRQYIQNNDPDIEGETRPVYMPKIAHKVGSVMQIKDETKGEKNYDGMELVLDDEKGEYVLKPIANTYQRTIFDADFTCVNDEDDILSTEDKVRAALPAPIDEDEESQDDDMENGAEGYMEM